MRVPTLTWANNFSLLWELSSHFNLSSITQVDFFYVNSLSDVDIILFGVVLKAQNIKKKKNQTWV